MLRIVLKNKVKFELTVVFKICFHIFSLPENTQQSQSDVSARPTSSKKRSGDDNISYDEKNNTNKAELQSDSSPAKKKPKTVFMK